MSSSTPAPTANPTSAAPTSVKRACDACHRRKVKCDGLNPCRNCHSAQLSCTYHAIPQKKGPKGSRAKVISELRETQRQTTLSTKVANRMNGLHSPPCSPTLAPTPGLLTPEIITQSIDFFFANMYPTMPILHRGRLEQQARFADRDIDTYCLLTSLCAFMMIQPGMSIPGGDAMGLDSMPGANLVSGTMLMEETLRVRKGYDHLETPTVNSLATSFFLFGCYFGLDLHNKAWFHLREATTLAHILGMNKEDTYMQYDVIESSRRRRLYWLLFVTERAYALQRHRPLTLQATISLPTAADDPTEPAPPLTGFIHLVSLFRPFDDMFIALWNKARTDCSPAYLSALQKQLTEALPTYLNSTENQTADLRISQQWLRTMVWQLSIQNGCLSSNSDDPAMTFQYPVEIARDLLSMTSQFSQSSMEVHGVGLIEKLFDVACSLTDVLALLPTPNDPFVLGPRDYLTQFLSLLSTLRNGDSRFLPLLLSKVHDVLPRLASPMLQTLPDAAKPADFSAMDPSIDIFDGFGNAGMGVPATLPSHNHTHFEGKPIEDLHTSPGGSIISVPGVHVHGHINEANQNNAHTPFTSPPLISSGMDFGSLNEFPGFGEMNQPIVPGQGQVQTPQQAQHQQSQQSQQQRQSMVGLPMRQGSQSSVYSASSGSLGGGSLSSVSGVMPPRSVPSQQQTPPQQQQLEFNAHQQQQHEAQQHQQQQQFSNQRPSLQRDDSSMSIGMGMNDMAMGGMNMMGNNVGMMNPNMGINVGVVPSQGVMHGHGMAHGQHDAMEMGYR